jgi:hypothetical protein
MIPINSWKMTTSSKRSLNPHTVLGSYAIASSSSPIDPLLNPTTCAHTPTNKPNADLPLFVEGYPENAEVGKSQHGENRGELSLREKLVPQAPTSSPTRRI